MPTVPLYPLTEVSVKELEPEPLELAEDKVTSVTAKVKLGLAANPSRQNKLIAIRNPRTTKRRYRCMTGTLSRAA